LIYFIVTWILYSDRNHHVDGTKTQLYNKIHLILLTFQVDSFIIPDFKSV